MPTGYTSKVGDNPEYTFSEFAWHCARNFGAFIAQRDDNGPPVLEESVGDYDSKKIAECEEKLAIWKELSHEEKIRAATQAADTKVAQEKKWADDKLATKTNYEAMLEKVQGWEPPTKEHEDMKRFMGSQLSESIRFDCTPYPAPVFNKAAFIDKFIFEYESKIHGKLERHYTDFSEEKARVESRNKWKAELAKSIGMPKTP